MQVRDTRTVANSDHELRRALRAGGLRVTSQRLLIHRVLRELDGHVTAEEVRAEVGDRLPGISLPTVYATLELFERLGIVRRLDVRGVAVLYDARPDEHHHLVCRHCGGVEDLDARVDVRGALSAARRRGFAPTRAGVVVSGLCRRCR